MEGNALIEISIANNTERGKIYKLRHDVYASELGQHPLNDESTIQDRLDDFNVYIVARIKSEIIGFISVTPPIQNNFSIDKYFARKDIPFEIDASTFEMRILTVIQPHRGKPVAAALMWAAFRWIQSQGGTRIIAIGRSEVLDMYLKLGFHATGNKVNAGSVTYTLIHRESDALNTFLEKNFKEYFARVGRKCDWRMPVDFFRPAQCYHGGAFFDAIGTEFDDLGRAKDIINADVLDAWFDPPSRLLNEIQQHLAWIFKTSPPTDCSGMASGIAKARGLQPNNILPGAGSSDLIFLAFREWLSPKSRVLILDPTYGEYTHVLENIIRCQVDRIDLKRSNHYKLDIDEFLCTASSGYDLIVIVNPNSPTGQHIPITSLESALSKISPSTRIWVDETYIEYCGKGQSLERFAVRTQNIIVCKSMSKVYALSGLRAAYLCASPFQLEKLRSLTPPWAVSLPSQIAAVLALKESQYYEACYAQTHELRDAFSKQMKTIHSLDILESKANFVLCFLPENGPDAATVVAKCRERGLFVRDVSNMGRNFNKHTIRIAIKDEKTNNKMIQIISEVLKKM